MAWLRWRRFWLREWLWLSVSILTLGIFTRVDTQPAMEADTGVMAAGAAGAVVVAVVEAQQLVVDGDTAGDVCCYIRLCSLNAFVVLEEGDAMAWPYGGFGGAGSGSGSGCL